MMMNQQNKYCDRGNTDRRLKGEGLGPRIGFLEKVTSDRDGIGEKSMFWAEGTGCINTQR